jgi:hypothetical protein
VNHFINILEGTVAAIIGTLVWLTVLAIMLSPKIKIAQVIAKGHDTNGESCYRIRIDNLGRRPAIDLRFDCSVVFPVEYADGGTNRRVIVSKAGEEPLILPGKRHGQDNVYAMRYGAELPQLIRAHPGAWLRLRIFARDGLSGVGKVFTHEFTNPLDLIVDKQQVQHIAAIPVQSEPRGIATQNSKSTRQYRALDPPDDRPGVPR